MKRNTMKVLSMLLALVMLLGAIPFVAADETAPKLTATASKTEIWAGEAVTLDLEVGNIADPWFVVPNSVKWNNNAGDGEHVTVNPTANTTYIVTYKLAKSDDLNVAVDDSATVSIKVKQPSLATITLSGTTTAAVNKAAALTLTGANDSDIEWHVSPSGASVTDGVFTATKTGTYEVYAVALNTGDNKVKSNTLTITVSEDVEAYTVTLDDEVFTRNESNPKMTLRIIDNATGKAYTGTKTVQYTSNNTSVVAIKSKTDGTLTLYKEGSAVITATVTIDGKTYTAKATVKVGNAGDISLDLDGESVDDDKVDLEFTVEGPGKSTKVDWYLEVTCDGAKDSKSAPWFTWTDSSESDKRELEIDNEKGPELETELVAKNGYGIAMIDVTATWDDEEATGTFYVAFYDENDYILTLKDDVDEFDFDDTNVFKTAKKNTTTLTATSTNIADLLDNETEGYVLLDEGNKANKNEDVGEITTNSTKAPDYDPDDENEYEMDELKYLTFEADDEGSFILEYIQYQEIPGYTYSMITGEGTIEIIVGEGSASSKKGDINYDVKNKGEVTLDEDDFEDFWDEYCDDEDITGTDAEFGYVIFDYNASKIYGAMYGEDGDKNMKDTYLFHFDYDDDEDDGSKDFDLTEVVYKASSTKTNYIDEIDFTCYSDNGDEEVDGTITFTVGTGTEEEKEEETTPVGTMNFTDVKTTDWYYSSVLYVYNNQIMAGTSTTKFEPNTNLSRAMVVTMLYRVEGEPAVTTASSFSDVKDSSSWYYKAVCWAAKNGIVNGVTTTSFAPNTNITREQLAAILYRYADYKGKSTAATTPLTGYADASTVSTYATTAVKWAVGEGIITGDAGKLLPRGNATRAQAAAMFQRFLSK